MTRSRLDNGHRSVSETRNLRNLGGAELLNANDRETMLRLGTTLERALSDLRPGNAPSLEPAANTENSAKVQIEPLRQ
jgi:hypothetical protein